MVVLLHPGVIKWFLFFGRRRLVGGTCDDGWLL